MPPSSPTTRRRTQATAVWRAVACSLLASGSLLSGGGCGQGRHVQAEQAVVPGQADFAQLYQTHCAGCHGADGRLGPAPPLDDPLFLAIVPDAELLQAVRHGRHGTPMPAFSHAAGGSLSEAEVQTLAQGIKRRWKAAAEVPPGLPPYKAGSEAPPGSEAVDAGERLFARSCASCHGSDGRGLPGDQPPNALREPAFLALISDQALRRIIITGRDDLGMPDCLDGEGRPDDFQPLNSRDVAELVALLAHWRGGASPTSPPVSQEQKP